MVVLHQLKEWIFLQMYKKKMYTKQRILSLTRTFQTNCTLQNYILTQDIHAKYLILQLIPDVVLVKNIIPT